MILKNWSDSALELTTTDGTIVAVPSAANSSVFAFVDKIWEKAGVAIPKTMDELIAAAPIFQEKLGADYYPLGMYNATSMLEHFVIHYSGKQTVDDESKVLVTEANLLKAYQLIDKLDKAKVFPPVDKTVDSMNDPDPLFAAQKIGGVFNWHSGLSASEGTLKDSAQYEIIPSLKIKDEKDNGLINKAAMSFGISSKSKYPELAADFINFINTDAEAVKVLGVQRGTPSNEVAFKILEENKVLKGAPYRGTLELEKVSKQPLTKSGLPAIIFDSVRNNIQEMRFAKITPEQAAKNHMEIIKKGLEELKTLH